MLPAGAACPSSPEAEAFVRFCYQRRRVGWPELYDEMCAVATRGLFRGMGTDALSEIGVGFSLFESPRLAELVTRIVTEEQAARRAARAAMLEAAGAARAQTPAGGSDGTPPAATAPAAAATVSDASASGGHDTTGTPVRSTGPSLVTASAA